MSPTMGKQNPAVSVHDHFNEEKSWKCKRSIGKNNLGGIRNTAMGLGYQKKKKTLCKNQITGIYFFRRGKSYIQNDQTPEKQAGERGKGEMYVYVGI